jgi:hypothetical protein
MPASPSSVDLMIKDTMKGGGRSTTTLWCRSRGELGRRKDWPTALKHMSEVGMTGRRWRRHGPKGAGRRGAPHDTLRKSAAG